MCAANEIVLIISPLLADAAIGWLWFVIGAALIPPLLFLIDRDKRRPPK